MTLQADIHTLNLDALIELFELDLTSLGGAVERFHAGTNDLKQPITFGGHIYQPLPIEATDFELSGSGQLPRPKVRISNIGGLITVWIAQYNGLLTSRITRRRTFLKYLDAANFIGGINPSADPSQEFPKEIWILDRKSIENRTVVEFELAAAIDCAGTLLPGRQIIGNQCTWAYRRWTGSAFDYSKAICPYAGAQSYDINGNPVASGALDVPSKQVATCCKVRFGANAPLPYGGFEAAGLVVL